MIARSILLAILGIAIALIFIPLKVERKGQLKDAWIPPPFPIFIATKILAAVLRNAADILTPAPIRALSDAQGLQRAHIQYTVTKLGVADVLSKGPENIKDLSIAVGVKNPENLQRLLRAAQSMGYFREDPIGTWDNTRLSSVLIPTHPQNVHHIIRHLKEDVEDSWSILYDAIKNDVNAFEETHNNISFWEYHRRNPNQEQQFSLAMSNVDSISWYAIVYDYNWGLFKRVVDVGGATGSALAKIMNAYPNLHGLLFDQPAVISRANLIWEEEHTNLAGKYELTSGSFLDVTTLPKVRDGDVIMMRFILHNWGDEDSITILSNLRKAIGNANVRLSLVEIVLTDYDPMQPKFLIDLMMKLLFHHAKERYQSQWDALLSASGFKIMRVHPLRAMFSVIECQPI